MTDMVSITQQGSIAIVTIDNPPVNAISRPVRQGLVEAMDALHPDDTVTAIVLACAGRTFIAGADIREFDGGALEPWLPDVITRMHAGHKPWIAVLHGTVLGGGLETALGCHYRIAHPKTRIGLPEVHLGILPGAGGTQRLPRIVGAAKAVEMVTTGKPITATAALECGLVDEIAEDGLSAALSLAHTIGDRPLRRLDTAPAETQLTSNDWDALRAKAVAAARGQMSPVRAFDVVRKAFELDLESGLDVEREAFLELKETNQSKALRHAFFAERAVGKPQALSGATPRKIEHMAVIGGGLMGSGIATAALRAGLNVHLIERTEPDVTSGISRVTANIASAVKRGLMSEEDGITLTARLDGSSNYAATAKADIVIEAVFEDRDVKRTVFAELAQHVRPDAILASNTSYIDPQSFTEMLPHKDRIMGLHFFSPAHIMRLVEVVRTPDTSPDVLATGFDLAKRMGKVAVLSGICEGFIGNRILEAYGRAAGYLLEDGCLPQDVDAAMKAFGMPMGPFEMFDMAGLQIGWATRKRKAASRDPAQRYSRIPDLICERGWFGQKTGQGYYRYQEGVRTALPSKEVEVMILEEARAKGITRRAFTPEEIQTHLHAVQVNEAAHILGDHIAERPMDVDMVKIMGYGYPRWRGGPMMWADQVGTATVLASMQQIASDDPDSWKIAPLLQELGSQNQAFSTLN